MVIQCNYTHHLYPHLVTIARLGWIGADNVVVLYFEQFRVLINDLRGAYNVVNYDEYIL